MTTLFDATLALAKIVGNVRSSTTTAAGSATTVVDSTRAEPADYWNDGTLWVTSGTDIGKSRKITDWALSGTTFTVPTMTSAPGAAAAYSVCIGDWPQDKLIEFVNAALSEMGDVPVQNATLTTVSGQEQYSLPSTVYDVRLVEVAQSAASPYLYQPYHGVWYEIASGKLQFVTGSEPQTTGLLIRLTYMDAHAALSADTDAVSTYIHIDRLKWAAAVYAWQWRMQMSKTDEPTYATQIQLAMANAEKYKRLRPVPYVPRPVRMSL